jgi:hypothetical protein
MEQWRVLAGRGAHAPGGSLSARPALAWIRRFDVIKFL